MSSTRLLPSGPSRVNNSFPQPQVRVEPSRPVYLWASSVVSSHPMYRPNTRSRSSRDTRSCFCRINFLLHTCCQLKISLLPCQACLLLFTQATTSFQCGTQPQFRNKTLQTTGIPRQPRETGITKALTVWPGTLCGYNQEHIYGSSETPLADGIERAAGHG